MGFCQSAMDLPTPSSAHDEGESSRSGQSPLLMTKNGAAQGVASPFVTPQGRLVKIRFRDAPGRDHAGDQDHERN
jgi:hypothetical protein